MTTQRQMMDTLMLRIPETSPGVAGAVGYVIPLSAESGYAITQEPMRMPIGMGDRMPDSLVAGLVMAGGSLQFGLDFEYLGHVLRSLWTGYARVGSLHEFYEDTSAGAAPKTFALQNVFTATTEQNILGLYHRSGGVEFRGDFQGGCQLTEQITGAGQTSDVDSGVTRTNYGFQANSYFDGRAYYTVSGTEYNVAGWTALSANVTRSLAREEGGFRSGAAESVNYGPLQASGELGVPMDVGGSGPRADLNYHSDAVNRRVVMLDLMLCNGPLTTCTAYARWQIYCALVFRQDPKPGPGNTGVKYTQRWEVGRMTPTLMVSPAEYHALLANRGPFTVPSSAKLGVKINGGSTIPIALTAGSGKTVDNLVTDINADSGFSALAVADNFLGVIRLRTKLGGSTKSLQIDTAQADTAHVLLGFDGTVRSGRSNIWGRQTVLNGISADY